MAEFPTEGKSQPNGNIHLTMATSQTHFTQATTMYPSPPPQHPQPSQQTNNHPIVATIHTITRGSNLNFQNKR
jgi:hypothetical protein